MNIIRTLIISLAIVLTGCASNPMLVKTNQTLVKPQGQESQVVFMRSSFVGSAINASLYDVTSGTPVFIGIMADSTKIAYNTKPGKHVFMVVSEAADFLEADISAGKTYYSLVTPRMGMWRARFSLWPMKNDANAEHQLNSKEFKNVFKDTKLVENSEKSNLWFTKNKASVISKYNEYWPVWQKKPAQDVAKRSLSAEDGQ
jgi:hypothetical protein